MAACVCACAAPAAAQDTITDERVWFTLSLQDRASSNERWLWTVETILRSREGVSELDVFSLRPILAFKLASHSSVAGGYSLNPSFPASGGTTLEQRAFGQYVFTHALFGGTVSYRARLEARFIEDNSGMQMRMRHQARYSRPFHGGGKVGWIAYDELLVHVNETTKNARGVDQNRGFGGVQIAAWSGGRVEAGYLNQFLPGHRGAADRMNHILSTVLAISF
jgi:hypothetical protein